MFTKSDLMAAEQLRRALQILAGTLPEEVAREVARVYPNWRPGTSYTSGQYLSFGSDDNGDPLLYKVIQPHISQEDWPPDITPALYACFSVDGDAWPIWSPPAGAHDAYNTGDVVSHNGELWQSRIDGNTTEPGSDDRWWSRYEPV